MALVRVLTNSVEAFISVQMRLSLQEFVHVVSEATTPGAARRIGAVIGGAQHRAGVVEHHCDFQAGGLFGLGGDGDGDVVDADEPHQGHRHRGLRLIVDGAAVKSAFAGTGVTETFVAERRRRIIGEEIILQIRRHLRRESDSSPIRPPAPLHRAPRRAGPFTA